MKLAPSILACDFGRLADEIAAVDRAGADWIHVDVMDGHFVPNITIGPLIVEAARRATELPLDVHLMIDDPDRYLDTFVEAGADFVTVHAEATRHLHRTVQRIRQLGAKAGVAFNPATPLSAVTELGGDVDLVLVMSVNPGFGGQTFIGRSLGKVAEARDLLDRSGSTAELEVDGGVDARNAAALAAAGASVLVAGSAVFAHPDGPRAGVRTIAGAMGGARCSPSPVLESRS